MELSASGWLIMVMAAIFVGLSKGGLASVGMLGVPVAALVMPPVQAAGLLLPVYVASDIIGVWAWRRSFDAGVLRILIPATLIGVVFGWATASVVPERAVAGLIGLIGVVFSLNALLRKRAVGGEARKPRPIPGIFWGSLTGFTSFVSHSGAPPYQVYVLPLGLSSAVYAGTTTLLFAWVNAVKLVPYWALGQLSPANLGIAAVLAIPAGLAVLLGVKLVRIIPQRLFFRLVTWALLLVSLKLLWEAV